MTRITARTNATRSLSYDANGNVAALIDTTSGEIVGEYEYGLFGEEITNSGSLNGTTDFCCSGWRVCMARSPQTGTPFMLVRPA